MPSNGPHLQRLISGVTGELFANDFRSFLRMIDSLVQLAVISKTLTAPPGSPANGDRYIVAASPTGAWTGFANKVVTWTTDDPNVPAGFWDTHTPNAGFLAYNLADSALYIFDGTNWNSSGVTPVTSVFGRTGAVVAATSDYSFSQISGSVAATQLPNPGAASLGGIKSLASAAHNWINAISTSGVPSATQPALLDLSDVPASYSGAGGKAVEVNSGATALVFSAKPFDVSTFAPGLGSNSQILLRVKLARAVTFPASATLSQASASANATGSTTFTLKKNGTSFATVNYAASSSSGTWTQASDAVFAAGDLLEIDGPATADATLANVGITLAGVRS
jgi:hypothetical protein